VHLQEQASEVCPQRMFLACLQQLLYIYASLRVDFSAAIISTCSCHVSDNFQKLYEQAEQNVSGIWAWLRQFRTAKFQDIFPQRSTESRNAPKTAIACGCQICNLIKNAITEEPPYWLVLNIYTALLGFQIVADDFKRDLIMSTPISKMLGRQYINMDYLIY